MDPATGIIIGSSIAAGASSANTALGLLGSRKPTSTTHQAKVQLKYDKKYADWAARELPMLNRQGMEAAGFNPILAINSGTGQNGNISVSGHQAYNEFGNNLDLAGDVAKAFQTASAMNQLEIQKAQADFLKSQSSLNDSKVIQTLDSVEHPKTLFGSINKYLHNAADFWFGSDESSARSGLLRDVGKFFKDYVPSSAIGMYGHVKDFFSGKPGGDGVTSGSAPSLKVGDVFRPTHDYKSVEINGVESFEYDGYHYLVDPRSKRILSKKKVK